MSDSQAPKISAIIPCFNLGDYVEEAVQSALASDFENFEVVLLDDGSTDTRTRSVLDDLRDRHKDRAGFHFIRQENQGVMAARNAAIAHSTGAYILPIDADNRIRPDYMKKAAAVLDKDPEIGVVYSYANCIGNKIGVWEFPEFDARKILLENFVDVCSLFRRQVWEDCGGFDVDMPMMGQEDWELWITAMEKGWKFRLLKEPLFDYRVREDSIISKCAIPENRKRLMRYICNKHRDTYIKRLEFIIAEKDVEVWNSRDALNEQQQRIEELRAKRRFGAFWRRWTGR